MFTVYALHCTHPYFSISITEIPCFKRAMPRPNIGTRNSHMAILILGGYMGHQIVPSITLSHPI